MKACNGDNKTQTPKNVELVARTPTNEGIEITRLEPVIIEVAQDEETFSHLILFEMNAKVNVEDEEIVVDGGIKETIYQMKEF
ncbi:hypothetical protein JW711_02830 [Candidatus Woesearchaeota archaeon]|nr:hypothetical protein [Candidatus Woesearchaeota archaeon]